MMEFPHLFYCVCISCIIIPFCSSTEDLVKVIVLFRHGMRTPIGSYSFHGVPDQNGKMWPEGLGALVNQGKLQLFELGQHLRQRYSNFLIPYGGAIDEDIRVVSTPSDRCYASAGFLLAGLYPPSDEQTWSSELQWQPVPILFESPDKIIIISRKNLCPAYTGMFNEVIAEANQTDPNIYNLIKFMSSHVSSVDIETPTDLFMVIDYFRTTLSLNLTLPKWISKDVYTKMNNFYINSFNYLPYTTQMKRLLAGPYISDIILHMNEVIYKKSSNSKFFFYSAHDSSLHSLIRSLGFTHQFVPDYGASVIFEIYRYSQNNYYIKLLYSADHTLSKLNVWTIPGCRTLCPMGKFVLLMEKYSIDGEKWRDECEVS